MILGNEAWLTLLLALISAGAAAWCWLIGRMDRIADRAREDRHSLATQMHSAINDVEDRLAARIAAIESKPNQYRR